MSDIAKLIEEKDAEIARLKGEIEQINTQADELDVLFQDRVSQCIALRDERDALSREKNILMRANGRYVDEISRKDTALSKIRDNCEFAIMGPKRDQRSHEELHGENEQIAISALTKDSSNG